MEKDHHAHKKSIEQKQSFYKQPHNISLIQQFINGNVVLFPPQK